MKKGITERKALTKEQKAKMLENKKQKLNKKTEDIEKDEEVIKEMKEFILDIFKDLKDVEDERVKAFIDDIIKMLKENVETEKEQKIVDILIPIYELLRTLSEDEIKLLSNAFVYLNQIMKYEVVNGKKVLKRYSMLRFKKEYLDDETSRKLLVLNTKLRLTPYSKGEERKNIQSEIDNLRDTKLESRYIKYILRKYIDENGDMNVELDEIQNEIKKVYKKEVSIDEIRKNYDELQDIIAKKKDEKERISEKGSEAEEVKVFEENEEDEDKKIKTKAKARQLTFIEKLMKKEGLLEDKKISPIKYDYNIEYKKNKSKIEEEQIKHILGENIENGELKVGYEDIQKKIYNKYKINVPVYKIENIYKDIESEMMFGDYTKVKEVDIEKIREESKENYNKFLNFLKEIPSNEMEIINKIENFVNTEVNKTTLPSICKILEKNNKKL